MDTMDSIQIFLCTVCFKYSQYYIEVILMAENEKEAKDKFISKCLEKYNKIVSIDFMQFYDGDGDGDVNGEDGNVNGEDEKLLFDFPKDNTSKFEKYLNTNSEIECLHNCSFEIINKYD